MTSSVMCSNPATVRSARRRALPPRRGFTLTELLAVLGIVLVIVVGTLSVWLALAGSLGPGRAASVIQAMLNGARDYAVSNGKYTRVLFRNDLDQAEGGTRMFLQYYTDPGAPTSSLKWADVPGVEQAGRNLFILKDIPNLPNAPARPDDLEDVGAASVKAWEEYRADVCIALTDYAFTNVSAKGYLEDNAAFNTGQDEFYVTFDPTGTLMPESSEVTATLVIIQLAGQRVGEYEFYVMNVNTGTRLVFE